MKKIIPIVIISILIISFATCDDETTNSCEDASKNIVKVASNAQMCALADYWYNKGEWDNAIGGTWSESNCNSSGWEIYVSEAEAEASIEEWCKDDEWDQEDIDTGAETSSSSDIEEMLNATGIYTK